MNNKGGVNPMDKESQERINSSPSKTWPFLLYWMAILPMIIALEYFNPIGIDLKMLVYLVGGCCIAYMGGEYANDFIKNKSLIDGVGKIDNIDRHRNLIAIWILYSALSLAASYKFDLDLGVTSEITTFAAFLSLAYISGNKVNKSAVTIGINKYGTNGGDNK